MKFQPIFFFSFTDFREIVTVNVKVEKKRMLFLSYFFRDRFLRNWGKRNFPQFLREIRNRMQQCVLMLRKTTKLFLDFFFIKVRFGCITNYHLWVFNFRSLLIINIMIFAHPSPLWEPTYGVF